MAGLCPGHSRLFSSLKFQRRGCARHKAGHDGLADFRLKPALADRLDIADRSLGAVGRRRSPRPGSVDPGQDLSRSSPRLISAGANGFYVIFCAMTLGWAKGSQPATDYAALYGVSRLAATLLMVGVTRLISLIGWPAFYACAAIALIVASVIFQRPKLSELWTS